MIEQRLLGENLSELNLMMEFVGINKFFALIIIYDSKMAPTLTVRSR